MKIIRTLLLFLTFHFSANAEDSTTVNFNRYALGVRFSPDYCYRTLSGTNSYTNFRNTAEQPMWGYTGGIDFSYYVKKEISVSLGVHFSQKGYEIGSIPASDMYGNIVGDAHIRYNYNYIQLPLNVNFIFGKKKIRFIASVGASSSFLLYQQTITEIKYTNGPKTISGGKPNYSYNRFNLFLNGSIGADIALGNKMGLRIEPTYNYGLLQTIDASITEKLWSAGLNIGCYFRF